MKTRSNGSDPSTSVGSTSAARPRQDLDLVADARAIEVRAGDLGVRGLRLDRDDACRRRGCRAPARSSSSAPSVPISSTRRAPEIRASRCRSLPVTGATSIGGQARGVLLGDGGLEGGVVPDEGLGRGRRRRGARRRGWGRSWPQPTRGASAGAPSRPERVGGSRRAGPLRQRRQGFEEAPAFRPRPRGPRRASPRSPIPQSERVATPARRSRPWSPHAGGEHVGRQARCDGAGGESAARRRACWSQRRGGGCWSRGESRGSSSAPTAQPLPAGYVPRRASTPQSVTPPARRRGRLPVPEHGLADSTPSARSHSGSRTTRRGRMPPAAARAV